jgi:hypothetical protein
MTKQSDNERDDNSGRTAKKPYRPPRLVEYGDLRKITQAKGGMMNDAGRPATRK